MRWRRKGPIFNASGESDMHFSHAQIPSPLVLSGDACRIYYSARDREGRTRPFFLDYDFVAETLIRADKRPLFAHGATGSFDDSGIMPSCALHVGGEIFLYYIAWNRRVSVPYHLSIGLAISRDGGESFDRYAAGPVMDRNADEPFFNTAPHVILQDGAFVMHYISCTGWVEIKGRHEPVYRVRRARSWNGVDWRRDDGTVIDYAFDGEAIGRPWVMPARNGGGCEMWYSRRGSLDYREPGGQHYVIGYAASADGETWDRRDEEAGIETAKQGWDSEMIEYCSVIRRESRDIMLYNGNGFGASGFGWAERISA
jgi:hypothetical protein